MGLLGDFVGAFATNVGNEMLDNERQQQAMALQEALERRRIARAQNIKTKTAVPVPIPFGNPVQRGPGNWEQPTKIERGALLNENTLELDRPASLEDGPYLPATDPNALTPAQAETARQKELDRASRENAARIRGSSRGGGGSSRAPIGKDGLTADQRADNARADAKEKRLAGKSGAGGMTEKGWREGMDQTLSSIQGAEAGKLKSIIRQYGGMDDPVIQSMVKRNEAGEVDGEALREAAYVTAEKYWNERKPSNKKASESKQEDAGMTLAEALDYARKKAGGKLSPDVERQIRSAYGAN